MFKEQKGITLVALVITIIVLLILAGVSISLVVGEQGILSRAQNAVGSTEQATAEQEIQLSMDEAQMAYISAWGANQAVKKIDFYKQKEYYDSNCVSAASVDVNVGTGDDDGKVVVTYTSKSNITYIVKFNPEKPSTTYEIERKNP